MVSNMYSPYFPGEVGFQREFLILASSLPRDNKQQTGSIGRSSKAFTDGWQVAIGHKICRMVKRCFKDVF